VPLLTVTTPVLLLFHVTVLSVALSGVTVAVRVPAEPPTVRLRVLGVRDTLVTETTACFDHVVLVPFGLVYVPMPPPVAKYLVRKSPGNEDELLKFAEVIVL